MEQTKASAGSAEAFPAVDSSNPDYPRILVDYCCRNFIVQTGQLLQVYEEFLNLALWVRGFAPHNVLEVGTTGATFFMLSRLSTGRKAGIRRGGLTLGG